MLWLHTQKEFQRWPKPDFCYLCGKLLDDGSELDRDHCPPKGMFHPDDCANYPVILRVHKRCNNNWHHLDERLNIFYDPYHGGTKADQPEHRSKLDIIEVTNSQGTYQAIRNFPILPLAHRIMRCVHAVLYGEFIPPTTPNKVHVPLLEAKLDSSGEPQIPLLQTYVFGRQLCIAQKTNSFDSVHAYNGKFRYICTWVTSDQGHPMCLFAFDIYRLADYNVLVDAFPSAFIGCYMPNRIPRMATMSSRLELEIPMPEVLYPIL